MIEEIFDVALFIGFIVLGIWILRLLYREDKKDKAKKDGRGPYKKPKKDPFERKDDIYDHLDF